MAIFSMKMDTSNVQVQALVRDLSGPLLAQVLFTSVNHVIIPPARDMLKRNDSIDTGNLFRNLKAVIAISQNGVAAVDVGSLGVDYGLDVEKGREPHSPDMRKLTRWAKRKLKAKNPILTAQRVSAHIQRTGVAARPYMRPTFERHKDRLVNDFVMRGRIALRTT